MVLDPRVINKHKVGTKIPTISMSLKGVVSMGNPSAVRLGEVIKELKTYHQTHLLATLINILDDAKEWAAKYEARKA